jgi:cell division protein FtsB
MEHLSEHDIRKIMRWLAWSATVVLMVGVVRGRSSIGAYFKLKESARKLEVAVAALEAENREMQMEIERIKSSKSYARKVLRDKYHVTDTDEKIIFFTE